MSLEPKSDKTEIKEFKVQGKVAAKGNSQPLQGVEVYIETSQGNFRTKSLEDGSYTLTFKAEVISYGKSPNAEALLVNFIKFLLFNLK